jgi:hypothetical protein
MSTYYNILPECYADTLLIEMLLAGRPNHQMGIGQVNQILTTKFKNRPAVGIVDNDKRKPADFEQFELIEEVHNIQKRKHKEHPHALLVIAPAFEDWVFENSTAVSVDPAKFGFSDRKKFRNASKNQNVSNNQQMKQFLNTLIQKKAPGLMLLREWIETAAGL